VVFLTTTLLFDDWFHFLFLFGVTGLMVVAEIFNSSIGALCDYIQPEHDTLVNAVKDMAVSASWVAVLIWAVNILVVVYEPVRLTGIR
jgi:diacylglycerol kinase